MVGAVHEVADLLSAEADPLDTIAIGHGHRFQAQLERDGPGKSIAVGSFCGTIHVQPLPVRGSNQIPEIAAWRHDPLVDLRSGPDTRGYWYSRLFLSTRISEVKYIA